MTSSRDEAALLRQDPARRRRLLTAIALGLCILTAAVYLQVRDHAFVAYDDPTYIVDNPFVRDPPSFASIARSFREPYGPNWIPLTWISLQLDHALYGPEPAGILLGNVALHGLAAILLFLAFTRMTGNVWPSAFVAAVFAVHPLHVESVAWATERKDPLSAVFWMATLLAYARYAARPTHGRLALVTASFAAGLMAKPMLVSLPLVLLLLDYWPLRRISCGAGAHGANDYRRILLEKLPLFALAGAASAITFAIQRADGALSHDDLLPLSVRLSNALLSTAAYVRDSVWPTNLAVFYPHPLAVSASGPLLLAAASLMLLTFLAWRSARSRPYFVVGWLWYLVTLLPVIGIVQAGLQARADRYTYLPQIGLAIAVAWGAHAVARSRMARRALAALATAAVAALAITAWKQVGHWRDTQTLFSRAIAVTEDNFLAHHGLGKALLEAKQPEQALTHFLRARALKPGWPDAHIGVADVGLARAQYDRALAGYRRALAIDPDNASATAKIGRVFAARGDPADAIPQYRHAIDLYGSHPSAEVHAYLGAALADTGDFVGAEEEFERAIALRPHYAQAHHYLGDVRLRAGRHADARAPLRTAASLAGESAELHARQAAAARGGGDARAAVEHYRAALRLRPQWELAAYNLAWMLATHHDPSIRDPAQAVRVAEAMAATGISGKPLGYDTLAAAYAAAGRFDEAAQTADEGARLARATGQPGQAAEIEARAAGYRVGRAYIAPE